MGPDLDQLAPSPTRPRADGDADESAYAPGDQDWGERVPTIHFALNQDRLRLIGLSPNEAAQQLQFLLTGVAITQVREDIRTVTWSRGPPARSVLILPSSPILR